jgi:hypothetical protein
MILIDKVTGVLGEGDIPPFGPEAQKGFSVFNKRPAPRGETAGPFLLTDIPDVPRKP